MSKKISKYEPLILNPRNKEDLRKIDELLNSCPHIVDEVDSQVNELFQIRHPKILIDKVTKSKLQLYKKNIYRGKSNKLFGFWVYYSWNSCLVHFLPEQLHTEIRTSRNRNLITKEEQEKYYNATVAIAGLSVGNSSAATLLYTGGPKNLRLADHDTLDASNVNRIRTSFTKIGQEKVDILAHEIYEVNPFSDLKLFKEGLNTKNLKNFLLKPKQVDVLVEEMDNLYLKIQIRLLARQYKIPVVMATDNGDNIVLDIERFDLDPHRPLLHGDVPEEELLKITPHTSKPEAARIISRWVGPDNIAPRMQSSLLELGKTLYTWPQLGTAALLAGCALAYSTRKIILKEPIRQGKFIFSFDDILNPEYEAKDALKEKEQLNKMFKKALNLK